MANMTIGELTPGTLVSIGEKVEGVLVDKPYIYLGLDRNYNAILLRQYAAEARRMDEAVGTSYSACEMDAWLENADDGFLNRFEFDTMTMLRSTSISYADYSLNEEQSPQMVTINRRCFLLSLTELGFNIVGREIDEGHSYLDALKTFYVVQHPEEEVTTAKPRIAYREDTGDAVRYWLRSTKVQTNSDTILCYFIGTTGSSSSAKGTTENWARPAISISRSTYISVDGSGVIHLVPGSEHGVSGVPTIRPSLYDLLFARNVGNSPANSVWQSGDYYSSLLAKSVTFVEDTATGNPATFTTDLAKPLTGAKIYFNPVQEGGGDPSPENIRNISGWTGANVVRCGKNLLNPAEKVVSSSKIARWCYTNGYVLRAGQTYTLSSNTASAQVKIIDLSTDADIESGSPSATYTPAEDTTVYFKLYNLDGISGVEAQLELGSTATTYAPYIGQTIPVQFPGVGKNLFNKATITSGYRFAANGTAQQKTGWCISDYIEVIPGETYTITTAGTFGISSRNVCYNENKEKISVMPQYDSAVPSFKMPDNARYLRLSLHEEYINETQLELGSSKTAYEPFNNTIYGGYVDLVNKEVVATMASFDMGSKAWAYVASSKTFGCSQHLSPAVKLPPTLDVAVNAVCSCYKVVSSDDKADKTVWVGTSGGVLFAKDSDCDSGASFKTKVTGQQFVYELATPIHYPLTAPQITALKGENVVSSNTNSTANEIKYLKRS